MAACTKCGSGTIAGPYYGRGEYGREWLTYRCNRCGYSYRTATKEESDTIAARMKFFDQERREALRKPENN